MLTILITGCMVLAVVALPARMFQSARTLGFPRSRRLRVAVYSFLVFATWFGLVLWGALSGFFNTPVFIIFGIPFTHVNYLVLGPVILGLFFIWRSATVRILLDTFEPHRVMLFETFRVVGAVFLVRYAQGALPGIFALPAGIGDVFIGVTAPVISYVYHTYGRRVRWLAIGWNVLGIVELVVSLTIGYLAFGLHLFPGVQMADAALPTNFPLILIPGFGVPLTILFHIVALRLLSNKK